MYTVVRFQLWSSEERGFGLVWFNSISTILGRFIAKSSFYTYKQFYFKQFSLAKVHNFNIKTVLF